MNHPSKNPILKKKKIKTLGVKNYNDLPRIRWTKHIKVKETKLEADKIRNSPNQEKRTDQAPKIKKMIYNNWIQTLCLILPRFTCTIKTEMVLNPLSQAHCIVASKILVWWARWMGVCFGSEECLIYFGFCFWWVMC